MELTEDKKKPLFLAMQLPSLQELAKMRIARAIWNNKEVISEFHRIENTFEESTREHFRLLEKKAIDQISLLPLPALLAKEIPPLVNFVGGVLHRWIYLFDPEIESELDHKEWPDRIYLDYIVRDQLRWTAFGTLDYLNTAKLLLRDATIPLKDRFVISCNFCMDEEIRRLWNELPPDSGYLKADLPNFISRYWYGKINDEKSFENPNSSPLPNLHRKSGNEFQYRFFWPKFKEEERRGHLSMFLDETTLFPIDDFFLFNQLDFEQQREVLGSRPWEILQKLLSRPWQPLFFDTFNAIKDHLDKDCYSFYHFLEFATVNECDAQFRDRFFAEVGPFLRNPSYYYNDEEQFTDALSDQVWAGNVDFVREILREELTPHRFDLVSKAFDYLFCETSEYWEEAAEVLETVKGLIEEWLSAEEWLILKDEIPERDFDFGEQLDNVIRSLDDFFFINITDT